MGAHWALRWHFAPDPHSHIPMSDSAIGCQTTLANMEPINSWWNSNPFYVKNIFLSQKLTKGTILKKSMDRNIKKSMDRNIKKSLIQLSKLIPTIPMKRNYNTRLVLYKIIRFCYCTWSAFRTVLGQFFLIILEIYKWGAHAKNWTTCFHNFHI